MGAILICMVLEPLDLIHFEILNYSNQKDSKCDGKIMSKGKTEFSIAS
jgi:hypothetical protein